MYCSQMVQNDMTLNHKYNLFWHSVCLFVCVWLFVYLFAAYDLWYKLRCQQDKEGKPVQWPPVLYLQKDGNCCWKTWPAKKEKGRPITRDTVVDNIKTSLKKSIPCFIVRGFTLHVKSFIAKMFSLLTQLEPLSLFECFDNFWQMFIYAVLKRTL